MSENEISQDNQVLIDLVCNRLRSDPDLRNVMMELSGSRQKEVLDKNLEILIRGVNGFLKNLGAKEPTVSQPEPNLDGNSGETNEPAITTNLIADPTAPADPNSDPNPVLTDPVFQ